MKVWAIPLAGLVVWLSCASCKVGVDVNGERRTYDAADLFAPLGPPPREVEVTPDFTPNPRKIEAEAGASVENLASRHGVRSSECRGFVPRRPSLLLHNQNGLRSMRLTATAGTLLYARLPEGRFACDAATGTDETPTLTMSDWPGDTIEVYVGHTGKTDVDLDFEFVLEDLNRPLELGWSDRVPRPSLSKAPRDPIVVSGVTPGVDGAYFGGSNCGHHAYRDIPVLRFDLKRPIVGLEIAVTSYRPIAVQLVGPISSDNRRLPAACYGRGVHGLGRLEPGRYAVRVGTPEPAVRNFYHVMLLGPDTPRDPLHIIDDTPGALAVEDRALVWHAPFLERSDLVEKPTVGQTAFVVAPKKFFVFAKFDMDEVSARLLEAHSHVPVYPRENEPLLIVRDRTVVAADGSLYELDRIDYVTALPGGTLQIPAGIRNVDDPSSKRKRALDAARRRLSSLFE